MSLTIFEPARIDVNGHAQVHIGAGFADVNAPKLTEVPVRITCALNDPPQSTTDVKTKSDQRLCDLNATERVDTRTTKMSDLTFYSDGGTSEAQFLAMVDVDKRVSMFVRPHLLSTAPLAVGDKGDAYNFKVAAIDRIGNSGDQWAYRLQLVDVTRSKLNVALA